MNLASLDLWVMAAYAAVLVVLGLWFSRRANRSEKEYFGGGRSLPWWAAGTSMIAASFASDTPLLVTGYVRDKGVWGNWAIWALGISFLLSTFVFARLWHRSGVLTEVELCERRYSGSSAAGLRGAKALFFGLLYTAYAAGAGAVTGLRKVLGAVTDWDIGTCVWICCAIAALYVLAAGLWGIVATDNFQFLAAVVGSLATAWFAVHAAGGLSATLAAAPAGSLDMLPPASKGGFWGSPLDFFLAYGLFQW